MRKTIYRLLVYIISKFIKTDDIADKFPISLKAIIIDKGKILLLKTERNEWDFPGGKINFNENPESCLTREVKEELNLEIGDLNIVKSFNLKFNSCPVFVVLYRVKILCNNPIVSSYEHLDYNFFSKDQLQVLNIRKEYKEVISLLL